MLGNVRLCPCDTGTGNLDVLIFPLNADELHALEYRGDARATAAEKWVKHYAAGWGHEADEPSEKVTWLYTLGGVGISTHPVPAPYRGKIPAEVLWHLGFKKYVSHN